MNFSGSVSLGGPWAYTDDITAVSRAGGLDVLMLGEDTELWEYTHVSDGAAALTSLGGTWNAASSNFAAPQGLSIGLPAATLCGDGTNPDGRGSGVSSNA